MKGRFFWNKRSPDQYPSAIRYFEEAIRLDPNYAQAYAGLADTLALHTNVEKLPRDHGYQLATAAARKALALDDTLAEAHTSLGWILQKYNFDWAGAEREFARAIELNPHYATGHHWRAVNFRILGRYRENLAEMKEALANDPLSLQINVDFSTALAQMGECDAAVAQIKRTIEMHGDASLLGYTYVFCGRYDEAVPLLEPMAAQKNAIRSAGFLGYSYARLGRITEARRTIETLATQSRKMALFYLAAVHGALGETDSAFQYLNRLYDSRDDRISLLNHPVLDSLRSDPRFQSLMQRMHLPMP